MSIDWSGPDAIGRVFPTDHLRYFVNDTYQRDPGALLGRTFVQRANSTKLIEMPPLRVPRQARPAASTAVTLSELIIDNRLAAQVEVLAMVGLSLDRHEAAEVRVINNDSLRADDASEEWHAAEQAWSSDPAVAQALAENGATHGLVVTGVVQKYLVSKKFRSTEAGAKFGGWGVNIGGTYYASTSESKLDVVYGVDLTAVYPSKRSFADETERPVSDDERTLVADLLAKH